MEEDGMQPEMTIDEYGHKYWYLNGKLHRTDGPAVEGADGTKVWYLNGEYHRADGPAIEHTNGNKVWYLNGKRHRTDGPAYEGADGNKEWYLNGKEYTQEEWKKICMQPEMKVSGSNDVYVKFLESMHVIYIPGMKVTDTEAFTRYIQGFLEYAQEETAHELGG